MQNTLSKLRNNIENTYEVECPKIHTHKNINFKCEIRESKDSEKIKVVFLLKLHVIHPTCLTS